MRLAAGLHAPNRRLSDLPDGGEGFWQEVQAARCRAVKFFWPEHTRADLERARGMGIRTIVRAPGEAIVHAGDVLKMLHEYGGAAEWIELGNEPPPTLLWEHCWYLEFILWSGVKLACNRAGVRLSTPGWTGNAEPPGIDALGLRVRDVYNRLDAIGCHVYGTHVLEQPQIDRINRWADAFPGYPLLVTEAGIAARDLIARPPDPNRYAPSEFVKAERYARFAHALDEQAPQVEALTWFISSHSTPEWGSVDPAGTMGYHLSLPAWQHYGQRVDPA